jgi:hypothetical protein
LVNNDDEKHLKKLMAMRMNLGQMTLVVGSVQQRKQTKVHKNWKK